MERKILKKKLLAILLIISLLAADFCVLSSNLVTYSNKVADETDNPNVEFSAYFRDDSGEKKDSIERSINVENQKLYVEIKVKNEGYLNEGTLIEIENSNFNLKENIYSSYVNTIKDNKVILKQITAGEKVEIAFDLEPIIMDNIDANMLTKISLVKLNGTYTGSTDGGVQYGREVCLSFKPDESAKAEMETDIITNKILSVDGINKRIIQVLVKSRLSNNQYPVEQTTLNIDIPKLGEQEPEVSVLAIGKLATNGLSKIEEKDYKINDGKLQITLKNEADENNKISWLKAAYDEIVVTYVYPEDVDASTVEINADAEIKIYNTNTTIQSEDKEAKNNVGLNNSIMAIPQITTEEIYKGKLYAQTDLQYNTSTTLVITNTGLKEEIIINEGLDKFVLNDNTTTVTPTTKYVTTEFDANKALEILGTEGSIEIINGNSTVTIDKTYIDSYKENNSTENILIQYGEDSTSELEIKVTKPNSAGTLEIKHTKVVTGRYTQNKVQQIVGIKTSSSVKETSSEENPKWASAEIQETISKVDLKIENNKQVLSTTETNEVIFGITLNTESEKYNLYKNPTITIEMPSTVKNIMINNIEKLYDNENNFEDPLIEITDNLIKITLKGEQEKYPETSLYLQMKLNISMLELAPSKTDKITMTYTNQKDTNTTNLKTVEQEIEISGQPGLLNVFNIVNDENTSLTENLNKVITNEGAGDTITFEIGLVNNTEADINNIKIIGKLPTTGNVITGQNENTLETTLKSITAECATIYYTENINAKADNKDDWTTAFTANAKLYLIEIPSLVQTAEYYARINIKLPNHIPTNVASYTQYEVIYNETSKLSRKLGLVTSLMNGVETTLTAKVGGTDLTNGDSVKEGEVIRYIATVSNNTGTTLENLNVKVDVPKGTTFVKPIDSYILENETKIDYVYIADTYYEEMAETEQISTTIPTLTSGQTKRMQYEVRVNTDITSGTEISNQLVVSCNNEEKKSEEIKNILEESKIRVTLKKAIDSSIRLTSGSEVQYDVIIENLSDETISDIKMKIISDAFVLENESISLGEISANSTMTAKLKGKIKDGAQEMDIAVIVTDATTSYKSNVFEEKLVATDATIVLTSPQEEMSLKAGDSAEYNIVIKNTGKTDEYFKVYYKVPEKLEIQSITVNGTTVIQVTDKNIENTYSSEISNLIYEGMDLKAGESGTIKVIAKVKNISETMVVTSKAKVEVLNAYKDISQEVVHTFLQSEIKDDSNNDNTPDKDNTNKDDNSDSNDTPDQDNTLNKNIVTGYAWIDTNRDGQKDNEESALTDVKVRIYDVTTNNYLKDENGNIIETTTDAKGRYIFNIKEGTYIILFEYDTEKYEPTIYLAEGVDTSVNSKAVLKKMTINGEEKTLAATDTINVQNNVYNLNIGLKEKVKFDLELNKYISKIVVQNNKGTKTYNYENSTFEKVEIHRKQIAGSIVVLEYTIKVKNTGDVEGYVKNIVDYLPSGLIFSSELNSDWYLSGDYLYTKSLENVELQPGEEKEIKLILTKTMTAENVGLINNRAEIYQTYNKYGEIDIDSTPNNQIQSEDDHGTADVIIMVATGGSIIAYIILAIANIALIAVAITLMIKNDIIKISSKERRR